MVFGKQYKPSGDYKKYQLVYKMYENRNCYQFVTSFLSWVLFGNTAKYIHKKLSSKVGTWYFST